MKARRHNTGFASGGVTCKLTASYFYSSSVQVDSFVHEIRPNAKPKTLCVLKDSCVAVVNAVQKMEDSLNFQNHECEVHANRVVDSLVVRN